MWFLIEKLAQLNDVSYIEALGWLIEFDSPSYYVPMQLPYPAIHLLLRLRSIETISRIPLGLISFPDAWKTKEYQKD